ncbi:MULTISPECIES: hypothetical protein [unclassified Rhodococcus (in: high G+C Gram-positive bacteria)]|uniref:hypothetical protein n=1 Tax=unclassified Rhodococcus (in: high G+C Gram-positive bacteria) TaxID=192944 RepID=UPI00163AA7EC|nr:MULTISPECIES: hypothetical protein [unclassified Rhodococcus (in: high G+C Gram-positive bacteria)]MBC2644216.1 hypothetical protein [Rhodococcus sp. 3A]MBC2891045.1 hypothetical protein [Rhodococcus sp. 4CII]
MSSRSIPNPQYSEPLARAAFELQSRLYNIYSQDFMHSSRLPRQYRGCSTLWLFGQFLAWIEIVRREIQVIDFGDIQKTTELQRQLFDVADILASDELDDPVFRMFRAEQRAIGEVMVVERLAAGQSRNDSAGYAEFTYRLRTDDTFKEWFSSLDRNVEALMGGKRPGVRTVLIQRALIDLINFLDPDWIRFPDHRGRGKIPVPQDFVDIKQRRSDSEVACFRLEPDPLTFVEPWAQQHNLRLISATDDNNENVRTTLTQFGLRRHDLLVRTVRSQSQPCVVEIHVGPHDLTLPAAHPRPGTLALRPKEVRVLNDLLRRFDRPEYPERILRPPRVSRKGLTPSLLNLFSSR